MSAPTNADKNPPLKKRMVAFTQEEMTIPFLKQRWAKSRDQEMKANERNGVLRSQLKVWQSEATEAQSEAANARSEAAEARTEAAVAWKEAAEARKEATEARKEFDKTASTRAVEKRMQAATSRMLTDEKNRHTYTKQQLAKAESDLFTEVTLGKRSRVDVEDEKIEHVRTAESFEIAKKKHRDTITLLETEKIAHAATKAAHHAAMRELRSRPAGTGGKPQDPRLPAQFETEKTAHAKTTALLETEKTAHAEATADLQALRLRQAAPGLVLVKKLNTADAWSKEQDATIAGKDATIARNDATIAGKDATIARRDATIAQQKIHLTVTGRRSERGQDDDT